MILWVSKRDYDLNRIGLKTLTCVDLSLNTVS